MNEVSKEQRLRLLLNLPGVQHSATFIVITSARISKDLFRIYIYIIYYRNRSSKNNFVNIILSKIKCTSLLTLIHVYFIEFHLYNEWGVHLPSRNVTYWDQIRYCFPLRSYQKKDLFSFMLCIFWCTIRIWNRFFAAKPINTFFVVFNVFFLFVCLVRLGYFRLG